GLATGGSQDSSSPRPGSPLSLKEPGPEDSAPREEETKGRLRMRSPSGFFIVLGVFIVTVGIAIAVVGYWPHKKFPRTIANHSKVPNEVAVKSQAQSGLKTEKLKLIGPLIMGIGLFVFICANTILHENRDRETKLIIQRNMYSAAMVLSDGERKEMEPGLGTLSVDAGFRCFEQCCAGERALCAAHGHSDSSGTGQWADADMPVRHQTTTQLVYHKRPSPSLSLHSLQSDSCNSSERNLSAFLTGGADPGVSTPVAVLPVIKLNNCVIVDTPSASDPISTEDLKLWQNHGYIRSGSIRSAGDVSGILAQAGYCLRNKSFSTRFIGRFLSPGRVRKECGSDFHLPIACGHANSIDLGRDRNKVSVEREDGKNRSWPRLDRSNEAKYLKLENREGSADSLIEETEPEWAREEQNVRGDFSRQTGKRAQNHRRAEQIQSHSGPHCSQWKGLWFMD
uniref:Transmembrane protein 200A n=1 Tax=Callorhinchus milii TaxID=7868 RepID=A0A4W3K877_CALMI